MAANDSEPKKRETQTAYFDFTHYVPEKIEEGYRKNELPYSVSEELPDKPDYEPMREFIDKVEEALNHFAQEWTMQLEECPSSKRLHLQGRFRLKVKDRMSALLKKMKSSDLVGAHLSKTSTENTRNNFYVLKEDSRILGPWMLDPLGKNPKKLYVPRQYRFKEESLRSFQKTIVERLTGFDPRKINCIVNFRGNRGKSTLIGWCLANYRKICMEVPPMNEFKDMMHHVCSWLTQHGTEVGKNMFIDFPRSIRQDKVYQFMAGIERLKDGRAYDLRYKSTMVNFDSPNIWLFMNTVPDLGYVSQDRWDFWTINEGTNDLVKIPFRPFKTSFESLERMIKSIEVSESYESDLKSWEEHEEKKSSGSITLTFE